MSIPRLNKNYSLVVSPLWGEIHVVSNITKKTEETASEFFGSDGRVLGTGQRGLRKCNRIAAGEREQKLRLTI